jgi:hypothetical protein
MPPVVPTYKLLPFPVMSLIIVPPQGPFVCTHCANDELEKSKKIKMILLIEDFMFVKI